MKIALLNQSQADPKAFPLLAEGLRQFYLGFSADYRRDLSDVDVQFFEDATKVPAGWIRALVQQTLDAQGALAYHDRDEQGNPIIYAGYQDVPGGELFHGKSGTGDSLLGELEHEVAETDQDPFANTYVDLDVPDPQGSGEVLHSVAFETEDVVQEICDTFVVNGQVMDRTNYALPQYFNPGCPKGVRRDRMGVLKDGEMIAPGGYIIGRKVVARDGQLYARCVKVEHPHPMAPWRAKKKSRPSSRTQRRLQHEIHLGPVPTL